MSNSFTFSKLSNKRLNSCHNDLQLIMREAIKISNVDFGIAEGHRAVKKQQEYFKKGLSKKDGIVHRSKHNYFPSRAVDIYPYYGGKANWDNEHLCYLAGIIHTITEILYTQGKIKHKIRWGANWDSDGIILLDQHFDDCPHFELIN